MNTIHYVLIALFGAYFVMRFLIPTSVFPRKIKVSRAYLAAIFLILAAALVITPFVWLVCNVFKDQSVLMKYSFLPPISEWSSQTLNFTNFTKLFQGEESPQGTVYFWQYIINSIFLACAGTSISLFLTSLSGYALAKYKFKGRGFLIFFMAGSMMFPAMLFLAPLYQIIYKIHWMDSYLSLLIPNACAVFGIFLFRQAMQGVPNSLVEAARMDGASEFRIYWNVMMPLVRPMTGAYCLITFLGNWNNFLSPQLYIQTHAKLTLPVILNQYLGLYLNEYGVFLAGTLLAIIPPAILFFALQKEFVAGLTTGATKG